MATNPDKNRHSRGGFPLEEKGPLAAPPTYSSHFVSTTDLQTFGEAKLLAERPKAASHGPAQRRRNSSNTGYHHTKDPAKDTKGITYITFSPPTFAPNAIKPFQESESLGPLVLKSADEGLNDINRPRNSDPGYCSDSSYTPRGTQAVPYNLMNNSQQSYLNGYPPTPHTGSSTRFRHALPFYCSSAPTPRGTPKQRDDGRLDDRYDDVNNSEKRLRSVKEEAMPKGKGADSSASEASAQFWWPTQQAARQTNDTSEGHTKSLEVELLMEQLRVERARSRNLLEDLKNTTVQLSLEKELDHDYRQKLASTFAEEKARLERESEARRISQEDILAKLEADKQAQEDLQKIQLDAIRTIMDKLGNQMAMIQRREDERQAGEERKKVKKELRKRQHEMKEKQREMEEQRQRAEQLRREEQRQKEEEQKAQEEREREEQKIIEEQRVMEEKRQEKERLQKLEQEALQRLRDEWAHQQEVEAQEKAEAEKLRLEQEEKRKADIEAMERLRETIRAEERERVRKEERKRQEDQRLVEVALEAEEEEQRIESHLMVSVDAQREVEDASTQDDMSEKLQSEIERLQDDLRRRAWGAQPDYVKGITVSLPQPEVVYRSQQQLEWDPDWKFPPSNPFSKRRRHVSRSQQLEQSRYLEELRQSPTREGPFGDEYEYTSWAFDNAQAPAPRFGELGQVKQPSWQNESYSDSSTAATPLLGSSQFGDDGPYGGNGGMLYAQNPFVSPQQQMRPLEYQVPQAQSDTSDSEEEDDTHSEFAQSSTAFAGSTHFHEMYGANQNHTTEGYTLGLNRTKARASQQPPSPTSNSRPRAQHLDYQSVFDVEGAAQTNANGQTTFASPEHQSATSDNSPGYRLNTVHEMRQREFSQDVHNLEKQRAQTQRKQTHPPPSVPTPPGDTRDQTTAPGKPCNKGDAIFNSSGNGNGHVSCDRGPVAAGFPPAYAAPQFFPVQYVRLDQGAAFGVFQNVPVLVMPVFSLCSMQLAQPNVVPQATSQAPAGN
ncbi:hypothetical protein BGZ63DRAFT_395409 [Mariannaea sp. PMI_226]|nr:hypothetical protein BGZ63DRAFT_395409 [Mariannaea sp. PMI_226]